MCDGTNLPEVRASASVQRCTAQRCLPPVRGHLRQGRSSPATGRLAPGAGARQPCRGKQPAGCLALDTAGDVRPAGHLDSAAGLPALPGAAPEPRAAEPAGGETRGADPQSACGDCSGQPGRAAAGPHEQRTAAGQPGRRRRSDGGFRLRGGRQGASGHGSSGQHRPPRQVGAAGSRQLRKDRVAGQCQRGYAGQGDSRVGLRSPPSGNATDRSGVPDQTSL